MSSKGEPDPPRFVYRWEPLWEEPTQALCASLSEAELALATCVLDGYRGDINISHLWLFRDETGDLEGFIEYRIDPTTLGYDYRSEYFIREGEVFHAMFEISAHYYGYGSMGLILWDNTEGRRPGYSNRLRNGASKGMPVACFYQLLIGLEDGRFPLELATLGS